jgi:hypothetical protein
VPAEAEAAVAGSLGLLSDITTRTAGLQTALACPSGPAVAAADALGPVPTACAPAPEATPEGGTAPGTTAVGTPSAPSTAGAPPAGATPSGPGGALPTTPPAPSVPPTQGGGLLPSLPLPLPSTGSSRSTPPPVVQLPPLGPVTICLPPLATIGDC